MDGDRFDALTRSLGAPASRRAALGTALAGGLLSAFGLARTAPEASAAQGGLCVLAFVATVRQGPSASRPLVAGGAPGELRGNLRFSLSQSGNFQNADLLLADGNSLPVVGQATGHGFQARIDVGQGRALVAVGVGEQDVTRCLGRLDGPATGPNVGDLGEWHAAAGVQNLPGGGGSAGSGPAAPAGGSGNRPAGGSTGGGNQPSGGGSTGGSSTGGGSSTSGTGQACASGRTRCGNACVDTTSDAANCSACGSACAADERCSGSLCVPIGGGGGCKTGLTPCGPTCADTTTDPAHCGTCGNACPTGEGCVNGKCELATRVCVDPGESCADGDCCIGFCDQDDLCFCVSEGSECAQTGTGGCCSGQPCNADGFCGTCTLFGASCTADAECCSGSQYGAGLCCAGVCTDVTNVGFACPCAQLGESCAVVECCVGFCGQDDLCDCASDGLECRGNGECCNGVCNADGFCGVCSVLGAGCDADADCCSGNYAAACCFDGTTLTTRCTDVTNIGFVCPGEPTQIVAAEEQPAFSCPEGQVDCGGVCTDVSFDPLNCGGCGFVCGSGSTCDFGVCGGDPAPAETVVEEQVAACLAAGEVCDPAAPGACCSGACNGDGSCA